MSKKRDKKEKTEKKEENGKKKRKVSLNRQLLSVVSITLIFILITLIIVTYNGLDIIYLVYSAVSSFNAAREIGETYKDAGNDFFLRMDNIEREYEVTAEIYNAEGGIVYNSSYKGDMSLPPYSSYSIKLPDSEKKNYTEIMDLGSTDTTHFSLRQNNEDGRDSEYLVGEWNIGSGDAQIKIKLFKLKSVVDSTAKLTVAYISFITIIILIVALIIFSVLIRRVTKPLSDMSKITHNMSELNFSQKCAPNKIEEISLLSDSINDMSDSLEKALLDLRERNKKLQEDIEQEKTIDQLRQTFISGVSHELKTPIAIIQGYAEGLKIFMETDPPTAEKYCDTIISETQRMNSLVMKLLDIIKYESGEYKLSYTDFNIKIAVDDWLERNKSILQKQGITAQNQIDASLTGFGDYFILSTVINNYMTNAVSHADGEKKIIVSAKEVNGTVYRVSVFNTGTPIAAKDFDKIWNSFYRADKAMSRSQGRFGLGLAIVAAIQKLHECDYGAINHEDGVEFWFDVKKYDKKTAAALKQSNGNNQ